MNNKMISMRVKINKKIMKRIIKIMKINLKNLFRRNNEI